MTAFKADPAVVRGRYAPSPTGALHLGNLRTALLAWLYARAAGGAFVLRVEDLDTPRVVSGATTQMLADLRWLGLDWDEGPDVGGPLGPYTQSARREIYASALGRLRARGYLYPCYCSRVELARIASAPHGPDSAAYPGTCRHLTQAERQAREAAGRRPSLRFRVPGDATGFADLVAGPRSVHVAEETGDFIVRRSDGIVAYQLAVVVDDALMGITQVVRGADLLSSTARQLVLFDALGYPRPGMFAHVPLMRDEQGHRMAKRYHAVGIEPMRGQGSRPEDVVGMLAASCGLVPAKTRLSASELLSDFMRDTGTVNSVLAAAL